MRVISRKCSDLMYLPLSLSERKKGMLHKTLNIKGTLTLLDTPLVMGILNVTPVLFLCRQPETDGGCY